ncbi:Hsp20/alpha crystallin family protein [candidate division KSB1 bacterium]|nr:Hsp20/alpha crystallin family protein [candidate division KSB1 bacterium]
MAIYRWRPGYDLYDVQKEVNRLFEDFFSQRGEEGEQVRSTWNPQVDIVEHENEIVLLAELPGVSRDQVKVSVNNGVLTLSGEKKFRELGKDDCYHCAERASGPFERKFTLPTTIDEAKIKAEFKDGVLRVVLPKAEAAKPKEIAIKVE